MTWDLAAVLCVVSGIAMGAIVMATDSRRVFVCMLCAFALGTYPALAWVTA